MKLQPTIRRTGSVVDLRGDLRGQQGGEMEVAGGGGEAAAEEFSPAEIEYVSYGGEHHLPLIMALVDQELSEPYSIFTYRYFVYQWPQLSFLVLPAPSPNLDAKSIFLSVFAVAEVSVGNCVVMIRHSIRGNVWEPSSARWGSIAIASGGTLLCWLSSSLTGAEA